MDSQEVGVWLEDCLEAASQQAVPPSEEARLSFCRNREALCAELALLLREAVEMKWPFVPEKWQYKKSPGSRDKANLTDLIRRHLLQLLALLKASIAVGEACWALAVVFLVDRFLYWMDESSRLLKITKLLHRRHPDTPVAPQLVIRQARVYLNSGKLQKAEYILSNLINSSGATGCWTYHSESDRVLVQAVSVQVRGLVLQKLGLWLEAAELVWASLVGYYALPQPDKKGIGTSLGVLANILVSMNDEDFRAFKTNPDIDLSFLGDSSHRLLSAAEAAKMAVVYSQYASLYVLTNVAAQGTCLLSYSFSIGCPPSERRSFLLRAREAFEIGLLTKAEGEPVISKQELHTFIKAAYSLTVVHKWLGVCPEWTQAVPACQKALARFYDYCHAGSQERDVLCGEIMRLVGQVKGLLQVKRFPNSDAGSFIPDSYRNITERPIDFTLSRFSLVIGRFRKYHASLCEADGGECSGRGAGRDGWRLCITALGTTVGALARECATESCGVTGDAAEEEPPQEEALCAHPESPPQKEELGSTLGSTDSSLGSSWQEFSLSRSPRPGSSAGELQRNAEGGVRDSRSGGDLEGNRNQTNVGYKAVVSSKAAQGSTSSTGSDMEQFEVLQAAIETVGSEDWITDILSGSPKPSGTSGATQSVSQLNLGMSSSSPNGSFSSQSSWEKISPVPNSPDPRKTSQPKPGERQSSEPFGSGDSFSLLVNPDTGDSADDHKCPAGAAPGGGGPASPKPGSLQSYHVDVNAETETDSPPYSPRPAAQNPSSACRAAPGPCAPGPCGSTEDSAGSPFEVLEGKEAGWAGTKHGGEKTSPSGHQNPSCYSCLKQNAAGSASPERPYLLTQQDYRALLAGICHECLLKRLQSDKTKFKIKKHRSVYSALHLKFSRATGLWTGRQTCAYIGEPMGMQGKQRAALWVQFLHQEERLSSYVGKDYLVPKEIQFHLNDVERQMTAQYYVTEFNKRLYEQEVTAQIFFIPSEVLLTLEGGEITGCITVEPYMLGDFVKLTNNTGKKDERFRATEYGIAFGHFAYQFSGLQEVVVDLQGWVTANGKGLTYLTDPQIHSLRTPRGPSNFADRGLKYFLEEQHGPECNVICRWLKLPRVGGFPPK